MKATPSIADDKIRMMESSIRCFTFGLLGLIPFIGPAFALIAGWYSGQARTREKYHWNPAHSMRLIGIGCAVVSVLGWSMVDIVLIWKIYQAVANGFYND